MEPVNPNSPAYQLASAVKALEDCQLEFADCKTQFKDRLANLRSEIRKLSHDIITGQGQLPLEGDQRPAVLGVN